MRTPAAPRLAAVAAALVLAAGAFTVPVARLPFAGLYTLFAYRPTAAVLVVVLALATAAFATAALAVRGSPRWMVALATGAAYVVGRTWWQVAHEHAPSRAGRGIDAITSRVPGAIATQWGLWVLAAAALLLLASAVVLASGEARRGRAA
jgi:hypothetical protein